MSQKVGLVVVLKDEVYDIAGWLAWHLALGFDTIIVFDDGSTDGTDRIVRSAAVLYDVRYMKVVQDHGHFYDRQQNEYKKLLALSRDEFKWLCFLDADEYLLLSKDTTVVDFLARYPDAHGIAVNWCLYGSNGHILRPLLPPPAVYTRHSKASESINRHVKSFVRPDRLHGDVDGGMHNVHCFRVDATSYVDTDGRPMRWSSIPGIIGGEPLWDTAVIMHFQCRSMEHFLDRARKRRDLRLDVRSWINDDWNREQEHKPSRFFGHMFDVLTQIELKNSEALCRVIMTLAQVRAADVAITVGGGIEVLGDDQQGSWPDAFPAAREAVTTAAFPGRQEFPSQHEIGSDLRAFAVRSHFQTSLHVDVATGMLVHATPGCREGLQPALLIRSKRNMSKVLLVRPIKTRRPLRIESNRQAVVIVVLELAEMTPEQFKLSVPVTGLLLTAAPPVTDGVGEIRVSTRNVNDWELFSLVAADPSSLEGPVKVMVEAYFTLLSDGVTVESLAAWIAVHSSFTTSALLQILLRELPKSELLRLSSLLSASLPPELLSGFQYS